MDRDRGCRRARLAPARRVHRDIGAQPQVDTTLGGDGGRGHQTGARDAQRALAQLQETLGPRNQKVLQAQAQLDAANTALKRQSSAAASEASVRTERPG